MNYKSLNDWNSGFHNWVVRRHPRQERRQNGFMGGFIFGERGTGKSTYCYKVSAKIYFTLNGYSKREEEADAYKQALETMFFDAKNFRGHLIYNKIHGEVTPVIVLDDASMHFGNNMHQTNPLMYSAIRADTATIRTAVTGLLINAPRRDHVAKCLRDYDDYKGEAQTVAGSESMTQENWNRKIRFYKWHYYPDEKKYNIKIPFQDKYSCFIPDEYHKWYLRKKKFFEVKYDLIVADKIDPDTRDIFIENADLLPSYKGEEPLKKYINKWKREEVEQQEEEHISEIRKVEKRKKARELLKKLRESAELEDKT